MRFQCFHMVLFFADVKIFRFWPKTMDYNKAFLLKSRRLSAVHLLHSGRCYEAESSAILLLLRCPFIWSYKRRKMWAVKVVTTTCAIVCKFALLLQSTVFGQKPIINFQQNRKSSHTHLKHSQFQRHLLLRLGRWLGSSAGVVHAREGKLYDQLYLQNDTHNNYY